VEGKRGKGRRDGGRRNGVTMEQFGKSNLTRVIDTKGGSKGNAEVGGKSGAGRWESRGRFGGRIIGVKEEGRDGSGSRIGGRAK
jgi:hypothetical protein